MADPGLSKELQDFLGQHISSVVQLELLLLLHATAPRKWTVEELARELRIDAAWAANQARDLCNHGLLDCEEEGARISYQYAPLKPESQLAVTELATAYADRRVTVISFIYSKPIDQLKSFADAFRLRRRDENHG